jgi:hypothetical protein
MKNTILDVTMTKEYIEAGINFEKMQKKFLPILEVDARENEGYLYLQYIHKFFGKTKIKYAKAMTYKGRQLEPGIYKFELLEWTDLGDGNKSTVTLSGEKFISNRFLVPINRYIYWEQRTSLTIKAAEIKKSDLRDVPYKEPSVSLLGLGAAIITGIAIGEIADSLIDGVDSVHTVDSVHAVDGAHAVNGVDAPETKDVHTIANKGVHLVNGYTKANGTHVEGYLRSNPDGITSNNLNK